MNTARCEAGPRRDCRLLALNGENVAEFGNADPAVLAPQAHLVAQLDDGVGAMSGLFFATR